MRVQSKSTISAGSRRRDEQGTATIIAVLILGLVSIFVALALSRVTTEATIMRNDQINASTFYAAQASLETMTRTFNKVFAKSLAPTAAELSVVETTTPKNLQVLTNGNTSASGDFTEFEFTQNVEQLGTIKVNEPIGGGEFENLNAKRTPYVLTANARHVPSGVEVTLSRNFISNLIPIYQFGVFYDDDMEFYPGPTLSFGGRVHTNGNLYLMGRDGLRFTSKVTAHGEIVTNVARNGRPYDTTTSSEFRDLVYVDKVSNTPERLENFMGSVIGGPDILSGKTTVPDGIVNPDWGGGAMYKDRFNGNLTNAAPKLKLPIDVGASSVPANIELIKRGRVLGDYEYEQRAALGRPSEKPDSVNMKTARFYNKPGLRITFADRKERLPGCYNTGTGTAVTTDCGRRLDGDSLGKSAVLDSDVDTSRGYRPIAMTDGYLAKRVNGSRLYTTTNFTDSGMGNVANNRQTWVKVEVVPDVSTAPTDVTEAFLSLGVTEYNAVGAQLGDSRAILKLQRYELPGPSPVAATGTPTKLMGLPDAVEKPVANKPINLDGTSGPVIVPTGAGPNQINSLNNFSARYTGYILPPVDGNYTIKLQSNGGVRLYLKEQNTRTYPEVPIINNWTSHSLTTDTLTIPLLSTKNYEFKLEYFNDTGASPKLNLGWTRPDSVDETPIPDYRLYTTPVIADRSKFNAEYFNSIDLNSKAVSTYYGAGNFSYISTSNNFIFANESVHAISAPGITGTPFVVPFPIEMFDTREGLYNDDVLSANLENTVYPNTVPWNGVMSMVDIDMANLRRFFNGEFDGSFPNASPLSSTLVPNNNGRIVYISDRRGDKDFDGEFDMEDIYGTTVNPNNGTLESGEDANGNGFLDVTNYEWEGSKYLEEANWPRAVDPFVDLPSATTNRDLAAFFDHKYYRRGIRLINGSALPGNTTTGLTVASENGLYIKGNYNATGVSDHDDVPTPPSDYQGAQVPASIVADAVTIVSNKWTDGNSFRNPFDILQRQNLASSIAEETTVRVAVFAGSTISSQYFNFTQPNSFSDPNQPSQGGGDYRRMNGGVHNLMRHLEWWAGSNSYLNYCGSLINMFNSRNNTGSYKYIGRHIYSAPKRNYVFDSSFTDNTRLPPGTPYVQHAQVTGFRLFTN